MDYKFYSKNMEWFCLGVIFIGAAITRILGSGNWAVEGDELFTYSRALNNDYSYSLSGIYFLVSSSFKLFGDSEFTLRLPSIIFGILSFPVLFMVTREIFGKFAALLGCTLLIFSAYHLHHSQFARYYSAIFFLALPTSFYFFKYFTTANLKYFSLALCCVLIGILFHPTFAALLLANCFFALCILIFRPLRFAEATIRASKTLLIVMGICLLLFSPYAVKILAEWYDLSGSAGGGWGYSFIYFGLQILKYFGIPICLLAGMSMAILLKDDSFKGLFFAINACFPIAAFIFLSIFLDVRPDYVFYVYPIFFMLTGYFCSLLKNLCKNGFLYSIAITGMIIGVMLPNFVSQYLGKYSADIRSAVEYLDTNYRDGDKILFFPPGFKHYAANSYKLEPYVGGPYLSGLPKKLAVYEKDSHRLWIILEVPRSGVNHELSDWLFKHTRLVWEKFEKRYDYTFKTIRIYLKE